MKDALIKRGVRLILEGLEVDLDDRNFKTTPERHLSALKEFFRPPAKEIRTYAENFSGWVIVRNHVTYTLCPHHLLPVKMLVSAAYVPTTHVVGLSKVPRIFSQVNYRPMLQEQLTHDFAEVLAEIKGCKGAAVIIKGQHMCMQARGLRSNGWVITTARRGTMEYPEQWQSFLTVVKSED